MASARHLGHLGAAGSEQGRDVVAWRGGTLWAFQCKGVQRFGPKDTLAEVEKVLALPEDVSGENHGFDLRSTRYNADGTFADIRHIEVRARPPLWGHPLFIQ